MDDIAQQMGISKKTIYQHFENKTHLVEASTFFLFEKIRLGIDEICNTSENPIEELYHIKRFVMTYLKNERSSSQYQLRKYYPKIFEQLKWKQFEVMQESMTENINRGIGQGIFRESLDVEFIARMYFNGMISLKDQELFPPDRFPIEILQENYLEYHLRAISTEKGLAILNSFINQNHVSQ